MSGRPAFDSIALADRAETVRELIAGSDAAHTQSIEKAMEAGRLLVAAKGDCKHGEWLPFLKRAGVPERKAQRLMQIAESNLKSDTVTDLGIGGALRFLQLRERAVRHLEGARDDQAGGRFGVEQLEGAIQTMEAMIELFPEEQRERSSP
ncbi:DUF3102 domain-containing protein [Bradyrhizobium sp. BWC-3-1]|uniref:DUF3102 domain-containing protein n=1 Tax=Bradyrhizobium sp. BWC-3-1 TaxID=3080012 RepID=UPI00293F44A5|nr:DUF3102 domain-containing protein [Bradyrhizobium sp. BWC-3-1]WOH55373.1 DUF3102 domain-containing protein [Bradyrhizobium sp. BWC-3-1]